MKNVPILKKYTTNVGESTWVISYLSIGQEYEICHTDYPTM